MAGFETNEWQLILFFPLLLIAMLAVCWLMGHTGGWSVLSTAYGIEHTVSGEQCSHNTISISMDDGPSSFYRGCMNITVNEQGVYLMPSFSFGHTLLHIPWQDISKVKGRRPSGVWLKLEKTPAIVIGIDDATIQELEQKKGCEIPHYS